MFVSVSYFGRYSRAAKEGLPRHAASTAPTPKNCSFSTFVASATAAARHGFVGDHLPDFPVFRSTTLSGIGYIPIRNPLCCHHVTEVRYVHLYDVVELNIRKIGNVPGLCLLKSQPISRMAFTACLLTSLPGLMPALQTCVPRLADIFNSASAIGLRLALLMQANKIFNELRLLLFGRVPRIQPV
jgi:hypothetical protein